MKKNNYISKLAIIAIISSFVLTNVSFANNTEQNNTQNIETERTIEDTQNTVDRITTTMNNNSTVGNNLNEAINVDDPFNVTFDTSTADKADEWINFKASQIIRIIQTVGKWITFIVFVICGIRTVLGVFGKSDKVGKGVFGMILAAVCFVIIQYADIIFEFLLNFIVH